METPAKTPSSRNLQYQGQGSESLAAELVVGHPRGPPLMPIAPPRRRCAHVRSCYPSAAAPAGLASIRVSRRCRWAEVLALWRQRRRAASTSWRALAWPRAGSSSRARSVGRPLERVGVPRPLRPRIGPIAGSPEARLAGWTLGSPWWVGPADRLQVRTRGRVTRDQDVDGAQRPGRGSAAPRRSGRTARG